MMEVLPLSSDTDESKEDKGSDDYPSSSYQYKVHWDGFAKALDSVVPHDLLAR